MILSLRNIFKFLKPNILIMTEEIYQEYYPKNRYVLVFALFISTLLAGLIIMFSLLLISTLYLKYMIFYIVTITVVYVAIIGLGDRFGMKKILRQPIILQALLSVGFWVGWLIFWNGDFGAKDEIGREAFAYGMFWYVILYVVSFVLTEVLIFVVDTVFPKKKLRKQNK